MSGNQQLAIDVLGSVHAFHYRVIPIGYDIDARTLHLGASNIREETLNELRILTRKTIQIHELASKQIDPMLKQLFPSNKRDFASPTEQLEHEILSTALDLHAHDIRFNVGDACGKISVDAEGAHAHIRDNIPLDTFNTLVTSLLKNGNTTIDLNVGQTAMYEADVDHRKIRLRISTWPRYHHGGTQLVSAVARVIRRWEMLPRYQDLGLDDAQSVFLRSAIQSPNACVVFGGRPSVGKTTSFIVLLRETLRDSEGVFSIEKPPEMYVPWIQQTYIRDDIKIDGTWTMEKALEKLLTENPRFLFIGETLETQVALLSLSHMHTGIAMGLTIHAQNALDIIDRYISLGADPKLLAFALKTLVSQRLVSPVCLQCCDEAYATPEEVKAFRLGVRDGDRVKVHRRNRESDCKHCLGSGVLPRVGVFEIADASQRSMKEAIETGEPTKVAAAARAGGYSTMYERVVLGILEGRFDPRELRQVEAMETFGELTDRDLIARQKAALSTAVVPGMVAV